MAFSSENFPSHVMAEDYYREVGFITSKSVADKFRYLNKQYKAMVERTAKKNVSNYFVFREYGVRAEELDIKVARRIALSKGEKISTLEDLNKAREKYGFIKNINRKTGELEFKTGGYGEYTQEERIKMLGIRDAILNNWALASDKVPTYSKWKDAKSMRDIKFAEMLRETMRDRTFANGYLNNHPDITLDRYENLSVLFESSAWQELRRKQQYNESIEDIVSKVETSMSKSNYKEGDFKRILESSDSVKDFLEEIEKYFK